MPVKTLADFSDEFILENRITRIQSEYNRWFEKSGSYGIYGIDVYVPFLYDPDCYFYKSERLADPLYGLKYEGIDYIRIELNTDVRIGFLNYHCSRGTMAFDEYDMFLNVVCGEKIFINADNSQYTMIRGTANYV